ncbi:hypothetical protein EGW08_014387 [Elysia chlorotica]|uniref:Acyl-CoA dehydrogenase/oxidase C-terminal domain-containing protein n=1 Tax=Elysia chlorotica TaxID=188477 RepID=A0A3S0ZXW8_ELYCH|nr:hypothetical protein EGW08_014387 [Elysia chlorotica]
MFPAQRRCVANAVCLQAHITKYLTATSTTHYNNALYGSQQNRNLTRKSSSIGQQKKSLDFELNTADSPADVPNIQFAHARMGPFFQEEPRLRNQFSQDAFLRGFLKRHVCSKHLHEMNGRLQELGERVTTDIYELSLRMESEPPRLEQFSAWGSRVDKLITSTAWQNMKAESRADPDHRRPILALKLLTSKHVTRLYQMTQFYLFEPSGGLYGCPLAMTNGAARTVELLQGTQPWLYDQTFPHLTSRDPDQFWTSGQWMTERRGGSDVASGTETVAVEQTDGTYKLFGYKWFSSATDADMTLTLARVVDKNGSTGTSGLSLFYLDVKSQTSKIQIMKLKNKLGTRQLPTAELLIDGATAYKISDEGRGVSAMSQMLTLTRIHTAVHAAGAMRRIVNLARDYAGRRKAFGRRLLQHPLHVHTLAGLEVEARAAAIFVFEVSRLLGRQETQAPSEELEVEADVLRLAVPLLKLYVSKQSVSVVSEGLECFGGQGYIEDTDLPRLLRDTQVTPIWEGTTNILSLDVLRAIRKSASKPAVHATKQSESDTSSLPPILHNFRRDVLARVSPGKETRSLEVAGVKVETALAEVLAHWSRLDQTQQDMSARETAFSLARIYMGALLVEHAAHSSATETDVYTAQRCAQNFVA